MSDAARRDRELRRTAGMFGDERWFRSVVENATEVVTILESDSTVRYVSSAIERVLGYRPEERAGTSILDLVHPDDVERALGVLAGILETSGIHPPLEFRVPHKDGSWRYLEHVVNNLLKKRPEVHDHREGDDVAVPFPRARGRWGVESAQQLEHLRKMGCDLVQGHHLARPLPRGE